MGKKRDNSMTSTGVKMSLPARLFSCTQCDYQRWDLFLWGHRYYQIEEQQFPMSINIGWCYQCDDLAAIEALPSQSNINELEQKIAEKNAVLDKKKQEHSISLRWWQKLANVPDEVLEIKFECARMDRRLAEMKDAFVALSSRKHGPRCTQCGSEKHTLLPNCRVDYNKPVSTGLKHPGCNGDLLIGEDGTRFMLKPRSMAYDVEGNKLPL